jgi:acetyl esterase/lipase
MPRSARDLFTAVLAAFALALSLWIVLPAPAPTFWMIALVASEYSLWLAAASLAAVLLGWGRRTRAARFGVALGALALALSLYPQLSSFSAARAAGARLSLGRYLYDATPRAALKTERYAEIGGTPLALDVYGAQPGAARPAVLVIHGGFWSAGGRSDFPRWDDWLVSLGYVVFDVSYRLAPQPTWRAAVSDLKCAVGWVRTEAGRFGVDPARLALYGRLAGGHLALLAAYTPNEPALAPSCPVGDARVAAVVALYAPTDLAWGYQHPANVRAADTPARLRAFLGGSPTEVADRYRLTSPLSHVNAGSPPTLLLQGGHDQLVAPDQAERLSARLAAFGVAHELVYVPYAQHAFDYHAGGWGSQLARLRIAAFLKAYLSQ